MDPSEWLSDAVFVEVLSILDAASLARCASVSPGWKRIAESDFLWRNHCSRLWKGKSASQFESAEPRMKAYRLSIEEGRRTRIRADDLCANRWNFWYTKAAGEYWVSCDPYWRGLAPMRRYFHRDGYVSADEGDPLWGGHECRWDLIEEAIDAAREHHNSPPVCVRINNWPPLKVSRTPSWGWRMENFMAVYESLHPGSVQENMAAGSSSCSYGFSVGHFSFWLILHSPFNE